jgi:hypothetical protein
VGGGDELVSEVWTATIRARGDVGRHAIGQLSNYGLDRVSEPDPFEPAAFVQAELE